MRDYLSRFIDAVQAAFPVNRVVALLTPVLAIAAGSASAWLLKHFPGLAAAYPPEVVLGAVVTGAGAVVVAAYKWLDGWQTFERDIRDRIGSLDPEDEAVDIERSARDVPPAE